MAEAFRGKTYSLYGGKGGSDDFYELLHRVADECLNGNRSIPELLSVVRAVGRSKLRLRRTLLLDGTKESTLVRTLDGSFSPFTEAVTEHLRGLGLRQRWDRTLATSREQYHLYMLEIELQNRLDTERFRTSDTKLAFLPHCLRDLAADCQSTHRGVDYVCKGCSEKCNVNGVSKLLRRHGVQPYIWMTANLRSLFRRLQKEGKTPGVLGIACIPELVRGMRLCARAGVAVVGIPLDANRCARWWGEFHYNTVNLRELEKLLGEDTRRRPAARVEQGAKGSG